MKLAIVYYLHKWQLRQVGPDSVRSIRIPACSDKPHIDLEVTENWMALVYLLFPSLVFRKQEPDGRAGPKLWLAMLHTNRGLLQELETLAGTPIEQASPSG